MKHIFTVLFVCLVLSAYSQSVIYVTSTGAGNQSGGSWSDALPGLQLQGRLASAASGAQFWIASGRYSPGVLRTETFLIPSGVQLYGGFAGNETQLTDRVLSQPSSTTFTGETGDPAIIGDNNRHVVTFRNASVSTRLDGIVITGGNADAPPSPDNQGGGVLNVAMGAGIRGEPLITNCLITKNSAAIGGGLYSITEDRAICSPIIQNCVFTTNNALFRGGGSCMENDRGINNTMFINCIFRKNTAESGAGLAQSCSYNSNAGGDAPRFFSCMFDDNLATKGGGAVSISSFSGLIRPILANCLFVNNTTQEQGDAVYFGSSYYATVEPVLTNCSFINNQANSAGSGLFIQNSYSGQTTLIVTNTILRNGPIGSSADSQSGNPTYNVTYSNVQGGFAGTGNIDADPQFVDAANGNYRLLSSSPSVNTGDPNSTTANVSATDLVGNPRVQQNRIDMGAYEFQGGTEIYTVTDGNWNTPSVWSVNRLPTAGERIQLRHRISLPPAYQAQAGRLGYDAGGQLIYSAGASLRLTP